ncbi:GAF and ANTAR domain-containing protein [Micromonospora sp. NBC_01796]|uniref:GAF and ANTAR domain-containing protein n=1 Tax=Micromonospora sp. NBC_01796 TaxID=2975987 RepID=UPI002DD89BBC|nr:GAF and ANTAR domain-containing protein [Micromonospora sp. NBC_01796]WSA85363.1 GAF and ANTAR domain-containing protein [Micromonospora sp. NBC_01796]
MSLEIRAAHPTETLGVLETAALLRELTAGLIASNDFDDALERLVRTSQRAIPGVTWCGVTVLRAGAPAAVVASDPASRSLDDIEYGTDGPALTAIRTRDLVHVADLRRESRWPGWTRRARALGVRGVISAPVDVDDHVVGAINLYAREPGALGEQRQVTAMLLAEHAGLLLASVRDRARQHALSGELDRTLANGELVGQAIAVIMTERGCSAPEALQVLRRTSGALSIPLREVAERLVRSLARSRTS